MAMMNEMEYRTIGSALAGGKMFQIVASQQLHGGK